jgi:hypothetical protein
MNDMQENKSNMYQNVDVYMDANKSVWSAIAAISDIATKVKGNNTDILTLGQIQAEDNKGLTVNKLTLEQNLITATMKLVKALVAFATVTKNFPLLSQVKYSRTQLEESRDTMIYEKAMIIHGKATTYETELADYLIATQDITAVSDLAAQYLDAMPAKRQADVIRKDATSDLKLKFKEQDALLRDLDRIIPIFESDHPTFVKGYFNARIIINLGVRHTGTKTLIEGSVINAQTQQPVSNAYVWILQTGLSYNTSDEGQFSIDVKETGDYTVQVQKNGYQTYTEDPIHIEKGNTINLQIELEPEQ